MKHKTLSNKEKREINDVIRKYNFEFSKGDIVEFIETDYNVLKSNNEVLFFYLENDIYPSLKFVLKHPDCLKKIVVDMGAVKFVVNGADIMRPGVVDIDNDIKENEVILVVDIDNKKPLAIGNALMNSGDMRNMDSGKVIKNIHYVGDKIWNS
ncbi:MAG: DUF1947 domain-containing protein [Nanoarchaeota archaeon]|nr:DUF1947 domain-containing protein [Nanoarchaeota archaeon]